MGDCAINISYEDSVDKEGNVTVSAAQKLAEVAIETARTAKIFGIDPKVAMLSFSTNGSGKGADGRASATRPPRSPREMAPSSPSTARCSSTPPCPPPSASSVPRLQKVAGYANTFIFPCIEAGNIGCKIAQRPAAMPPTARSCRA